MKKFRFTRDLKLSLITALYSKSIAIITQILSVNFIINFIGLDGFSRYSVMTASLVWVVSLGGSMLPSLVGIISRYNADGNKDKVGTTIFTISLLLLTLSAVFIGFGLLFIYLNEPPQGKEYLLMISLVVGILFFSIAENVNQGLEKTYINNLYIGTANLFTIIFLYIISNNIISISVELQLATLILSVYGVLLVFKAINYIQMVRRYFIFRFDVGVIRSVFNLTRAYFVLVCAYFANTNGLLLLLNQYLDSLDIAIFTILLRSAVILAGIVIVFRQPLWPLLCKMIHMREAISILRTYKKCEVYVVGLLTIFLISIYFSLQSIFNLWTSNSVLLHTEVRLSISIYLTVFLFSQYLSIYYYGLEIFKSVSKYVVWEALLNSISIFIILISKGTLSMVIMAMSLNCLLFSCFCVRKSILNRLLTV